MIEGVDFKILGAEVLPDLLLPGGKPVFKVRVHSNYSQVTISFDNRSGSWMTHKSDDQGRRKEPLVGLAMALSNYVARHGKNLVPAEPTNPFIAAATTNPFMQLGA